MKKYIFLLFYSLSFLIGYSQTTDLAISVEAQDLSGSAISQAHIYEEFQYLVTISNVGSAVTNAVFEQTININADIISYTSQNPIGGTTLITDFNVVTNVPDNTIELTGTIVDFPAASSIEVKVIVKAPIGIGGIATTVTITPPDNVTDTNTSNNISIISIDVTDVLIDFTVTHQQISPTEDVPINAWNDTVTYQYTITNNSIIDYPLNGFRANLGLNTPQSRGLAIVKVLSAECINATNGTNCITGLTVISDEETINSAAPEIIFEITNSHVFTSGGSITIELVYQYLEPLCALEIGEIRVDSFGEIGINHINESSNESNSIITPLLSSFLCLETDVCIDTVQISPTVGTPVDWNEEIVFETTICNNGPLDVDIIPSFRNISGGIDWQIISIECLDAPSTLPCNITSFANAGQYWVGGVFNMPVGEFLTIRTVIVFLEPVCTLSTDTLNGRIRSFVEIQSDEISDSVPSNNSDVDLVELPSAALCPTVDLGVTKVQISPQLPAGGDENNTTSWGSVTYEITATNFSPDDTYFELVDFMSVSESPVALAILQSVECISTTGTASCFDIEHTNIGIELDGVIDDITDGSPDIFWEILLEDEWVLPSFSSITFLVVIDWFPECDALAIPAENNVTIEPDVIFIDDNGDNNGETVTTFYAPCVDLVVQTFPEFPTVIVNQSFNWIVDITNSILSSNAIDVEFEDILDIPFIINGTPTCQVTAGIANCMTTFDITGNTISGIIPIMNAGSTVRILIPVKAPSFGGAFVNTAEGTPSPENNEELTPETNISISSVQVLAPVLEKAFDPTTIYTNEISTLTFTVYNVNISTPETNIAFTDNLPSGLTLSSQPIWVDSNGSTANFIGNIGDAFVGVTDLNIPIGTASCTFSVEVSSDIPGIYINNSTNFTDHNNIDTTQVNATLEVLQGTIIEDDCLKVPQVFTPNNDGYNDVFFIPCLEDYENNNLKIYNRYGVLAYQQQAYTNNWDGKPNSGLLHDTSKPLPVGTYYYILEVEEEEPLIGWVYLNY